MHAQQQLSPNTTRLLAPALTSPESIARLERGIKGTIVINPDGQLVVVKH